MCLSCFIPKWHDDDNQVLLLKPFPSHVCLPLFQITFYNVSLGPLSQRLALSSSFIGIWSEKAHSAGFRILGICQGMI